MNDLHTHWTQIQDEKSKSTEFASGTFSNVDSSTTRNWIACTIQHYHQIRRNTFPSREWFLPTTAPWLLELQHTMSYSVTTIDHEAVKGWRWRKKKPRRTIRIQTSTRYSQTMIQTIRRPSPSMSIYWWIRIWRRWPCDFPILTRKFLTVFQFSRFPLWI